MWVSDLKLNGIIIANILPFTKDFEIDEDELRNHIRRLTKVRGVNGIACNGHAGESTSLTRSEKKRVVEIIVDEIRGKIPVISGIPAGSTKEAIELGKDCKEAKADAIMLFPPTVFGVLTPEMAYEYIKTVANTVNLPVVVFQPPLFTGASYDAETLIKLSSIENVIAVKDTSWDAEQIERDFVAIASSNRRISLLTGSDNLLFHSFVIGLDGALIGFANIHPEMSVELFELIQKGDLKSAKELYIERISPLVKVIYNRPLVQMHVRIKEILFMLGELKQPTVRPPLLPISKEEKKVIKEVLKKTKLL